MNTYYRPLIQNGAARPTDAVTLQGGDLWFTHLQRINRADDTVVVPADQVPPEQLRRICDPRAPISGLDMTKPHLMGILNVTPDSFSDGGLHFAPDAAQVAALAMVQQGATVIDIGGESTRPGAADVPIEEEIARTAPVIAALRLSADVPISIDTRKAPVAQAALAAGADIVNDVSGFTFDPALARLCSQNNAPVCVMHTQGDPATMQKNPTYENVVLDVYDFLETQIRVLETNGIPRSRIIADPGIGFGKTLAHNLTLLQNISLFHGLGCVILVGASRKRFIGTVGLAPNAADRAPGSIAVGLAAIAQGVQMLRVHDVADTAQAVRLWNGVR